MSAFAFETFDKWCFLDGDSNNWMGYLRGEDCISRDIVLNWSELLKFRANKFSKLGVSYYYLLAPNKERMFLDYVGCQGSDPLLSIKETIATILGDKYIDPTELLADIRECAYSKGDTHWTQYGAFKAYQVLMERIINDTGLGRMIDNSSFKFSDVSVKGDLFDKLKFGLNIVPHSVFTKDDLICINNNKINNIGNYIEFECPSAGSSTAVIFRDSFMSAMMPFIARSFGRTILYWQPNIDFSAIEEKKPDLVISEQTERFLVKVPDDVNGKSASEYISIKKVREKS